MSWHRWLGVGAALFLLTAASTGFLLEHPEWLGDEQAVSLSVAADPAQQDRYLRGGTWGLEESLDGGATWRELPMLAPPENVRRVHFSHADPGRVFALGPKSLVTSDDGGRVWEEIRFPAGSVAPGTELLDVSTGASGEWLVLTGGGLLVSADAGRSWTGETTGEKEGRSWRRLVHDLHTGHLFGVVGRRVAEGTALVVVFLTVTGLFITFRRGRRRPR